MLPYVITVHCIIEIVFAFEYSVSFQSCFWWQGCSVFSQLELVFPNTKGECRTRLVMICSMLSPLLTVEGHVWTK